MSKYKVLWEYIKENDKDEYKLSYESLENILGFKLDYSFLTYKKELNEYGYKVEKISMKEKYIIVKRG